MTQTSSTPAPADPRTVISVDAMGGDRGPAAVVGGLARSAEKNGEIRFILHGPAAELAPLVARERVLEGRVELRDSPDVVTMDAKPRDVLRHGQTSSMWSAIECLRNHEATVCVSCGNTGALMLLSVVRLRKLPGVSRPAIACLWPSRNTQEFNVMLDVGADISASPTELAQYALMGASYARNGLGLARPRVGLLNVGTEEHKGRAELKQAHDMIAAEADTAQYAFVGFVEGGDIPSDRVDVIVTDGFTGNIALKTAEGTAKLISGFLRDAFKATLLSRLAGLLVYPALRGLSKRIDPRRVNGGVFLGLNGTVVKSHGSSDATGVSAAIKLAFQLAQSGFTDSLAERVAASGARHDGADDTPHVPGEAAQ